MALDSGPPSIEAVARACYARGLPSETWLALVREAAHAGAKDAETTARETAAALVALLASARVPPPLVASYLNTALSSALCPPHAVARAACAPGFELPTATSELVFGALVATLDASPLAGGEASTASHSALDPLLLAPLDALLPRIVARPPAHRRAAAYLAHVARACSAASLPPREDVSRAVERLQSAVEQLDGVRGADERELLGLGDALRGAIARLGAAPNGAVTAGGGRRRARTASAAAGPAAALGARNLDEEALREGAPSAAGDVVLLLSEFLSNPHLPTRALSSGLSALVAYRLAQAPLRGSTPRDALVCVLAEVLAAAMRLVDAVEEGKEDVVLEAWLFAKLPQALKDVSTAGLPETAPSLQDALADALRAVRDSLARNTAPTAAGMDVDGAASSPSSSSRTFDSLVVALCQRALLPPDVGASVAPHIDAGELQPAMLPEYAGRLAAAGQDEVKQLLDELLQSYASQQAVAAVFAEDFAAKASSNDVLGLSVVCDALSEREGSHPDALAVLLLHVEPSELLAPVRQVLDSVDTSQDDFSDGNPIERYGSLVLFLQLVASRFKLHSNLAHHLGSTTSFFTRWLPSCSAVFALSTLSDEERSVVSGWIGALFGEGISDDLMHATNPQTLLRVAPTILKQSLMARQAGVVDLDSLRDALSYFLQELLRFTLPGVLLWLVEEVERTPASAQRTAMLDILQTLVLAPSLPSSVTELIAPSLARLLLDASTASLPPSQLERPKLIKLISPYRPAQSPLRWAPAPTLPTQLNSGITSLAEQQLRADLEALAARTAGPPPNLARSLARARARAPDDAALLRATVLPALFTASSSFGVERAVAAALAAPLSSSPPAAGSPRPLLHSLVADVLVPDLRSWAQSSLGDPSQEQALVRVERLADVVAGAAVLLLAIERSATESAQTGGRGTTKRVLQLLGEGVVHARRSRAAPQTGEPQLTALDAFVDRLASWPVVLEACPALGAALAEADGKP